MFLGEHTGGESGVDLPLHQGVPLPAQQNGVLSNTKTDKRGERAYFVTGPAARCCVGILRETRSKQCPSGETGFSLCFGERGMLVCEHNVSA